MATSLPDARWLTTSSFFIEAYAATILGNLQSRVRGDRARRRAREQKKRKFDTNLMDSNRTETLIHSHNIINCNLSINFITISVCGYYKYLYRVYAFSILSQASPRACQNSSFFQHASRPCPY